MKNNEIYLRYGVDPVEMTVTLLAAAGLSEDIGDRKKRIAVKPNLVTPTPADYGATTHPEIVEGILMYLQNNGFSDIVVMEGSWVGDRTSQAYEYCGYRTVCEKYGVTFIDTQKDSSHTVNCDGMELTLCDCVETVDYMINVPVLKGHCQTKMTCALKNMKGLIPNSEKRRFHTNGLHKPIAHLSRGIRQDFIVVDHICGDPSFEEGGNPVRTDCIMTGKDPVLVDAYACKLLGLTTGDVPYVEMAEALGSGCSDLKQASVRILNEKGETVKEFSGEEINPYEAVFAKERKTLDVAVDIDESDSCSACFAALTAAVNRLREERKWPPQRLPVIAIGQGHRNKKGEFGIGNCCRNFMDFIPGCPPKEDDIYQALQK